MNVYHLTVALGCMLGSAEVAISSESLSAQAQKGKALYDRKCSQCHGENGDAQGVGAAGFRPLPRDFTLGVYKFRTTPSGELPTHSDLKRSIRLGMPYTGMPPWPNFSDDEVDALATYLESFSEDFADTSEHPKPVEIPKAPKFNPAQVAEGRKIFEANKCFDCHGQKGLGDGTSAPTLNDDWGHPIRPADLSKPWAFRGGSEREDIYRTISTGLNGTPMPSFANDIPPEDRWKVVDYVQSLSQGAHQPSYGLTVVATPVSKVDVQAGDSLFSSSPSALFPVIGQVVEDPRCFAPGVNAISVQAIYDSNDLVIQLKWHNMTADTLGTNSPIPSTFDTANILSDAVAIQLPNKMPEGKGKPYFLMGDKKMPVDLWFADLSKGPLGQAESFTAKGAGSFSGGQDTLPIFANYANGEWTVRFQRSLKKEKGLTFALETFIPIAFSIWDGSLGETGRKHGLTSWFSLYLEPPAGESPWLPAGKTAGMALILQLVAVFGLRRALQSSQDRSRTK